METHVSNAEPPIDPRLPVIDAHHHLFDKIPQFVANILGQSRCLVDDYAKHVTSGHNVVASVNVGAHSMWRNSGPEAMKPIGETEFLNGQAAMAASGLYGPTLIVAAIVGVADLALGDAVRPVLEAHIGAAPDRFRGVRTEAVWDEDESILRGIFKAGPNYYARTDFRRGFAHLASLGLTFDAFVIAPQLGDVTDLARAFPETHIVLNHLGNPVGIGRHAGRADANYPAWKGHMADLAACPNVVVKMGGLNSYLTGSPNYRSKTPVSSEVFAAEWRPYAEPAIELFGADRIMFESNMPTDGSGRFGTVVNAFQRITAMCSQEERTCIFAGTANRVYRLGLEERISKG